MVQSEGICAAMDSDSKINSGVMKSFIFLVFGGLRKYSVKNRVVFRPAKRKTFAELVKLNGRFIFALY